MVPPAPPRFSTTTCWPSTSETRAAMMRATMSEPLPGPNGTTSVTKRLGQLCAFDVCAVDAPAPSASAARLAMPRLWRYLSRLTAVSRFVRFCWIVRRAGERAPELFRRQRHIDHARHAGARQRIGNGVGQRGQRAGDAALARALHAERILRRRHRVKLGDERRQAVGARHRVIHERAGEKLPVIAVLAVLHEHLAEPLADAALHLAVHD